MQLHDRVCVYHGNTSDAWKSIQVPCSYKSSIACKQQLCKCIGNHETCMLKIYLVIRDNKNWYAHISEEECTACCSQTKQGYKMIQMLAIQYTVAKVIILIILFRISCNVLHYAPNPCIMYAENYSSIITSLLQLYSHRVANSYCNYYYYI